MPRVKEPLSLDKKLKVQVGICRRMLKEVESYQKEVVMNENKTQKMRDDGRDEYDIKKQEEILQESYMMIPHSKKQLEEAIEELMTLVNECKEGGETIDAAMLEEANTILTSTN